jgi:hypothetical protein
MPRKRRRRDQWSKTKSGCWRISLGTHGSTLRLFQKRPSGPFFCAMWSAARRGALPVPLDTHDRGTAYAQGMKMLAELLRR